MFKLMINKGSYTQKIGEVESVIFNEESLNFEANHDGKTVIVTEPFQDFVTITDSFDMSMSMSLGLKLAQAPHLKKRAKNIAAANGKSLSWRRGLVWVHPEGMSQAYTVRKDLSIREFLKKIEKAPFSELVSEKIWRSWL